MAASTPLTEKDAGLTVVLGYDIAPGVSDADYDRWLREVHYPDLLANPHLDRITLHDVERVERTTSGGAVRLPDTAPFQRVAELHFADDAAYAAYRAWFVEHPIDPARGPAGRTVFHHYLVCRSRTFMR